MQGAAQGPLNVDDPSDGRVVCSYARWSGYKEFPTMLSLSLI